MTEYALTDADGTVRWRGTIDPPPGGGSQAGVMARAIRTFTETAGAGIYTATVVLPQYAMVYDVGLVAVADWDADTAALDAGDTPNSQGYWETFDITQVTAYDPETMNVDNHAGMDSAGFDGGIYANPNGGLWGAGINGNGIGPRYYPAAGDTITVVLTTTGAGGTTGRLHVVVVGTDVPAGIAAAVKA